VVVDRRPAGENDEDDDEDFALRPDVEAMVEDDGNPVDATRHYAQDPDQLADDAPTPDEREQDDELELDQAELDELGLTLDDPHQPEPE
jgi:hypothetical protein